MWTNRIHHTMGGNLELFICMYWSNTFDVPTKYDFWIFKRNYSGFFKYQKNCFPTVKLFKILLVLFKIYFTLIMLLPLVSTLSE